MSTDLRKAIYARLTGGETLSGDALVAQEELIDLLAADSDATILEPPKKVPAVFLASLNTMRGLNGEIPYPCITFRETGGSTENRLAIQFGAVNGVLIDFEIWDNSQSGTAISDIEDAVQRLLDVRREVAPCLSLESGKLYHSQIFTPLQMLYDESIHAHGGLVRYQFLEARY